LVVSGRSPDARHARGRGGDREDDAEDRRHDVRRLRADRQPPAQEDRRRRRLRGQLREGRGPRQLRPVEDDAREDRRVGDPDRLLGVGQASGRSSGRRRGKLRVRGNGRGNQRRRSARTSDPLSSPADVPGGKRARLRRQSSAIHGRAREATGDRRGLAQSSRHAARGRLERATEARSRQQRRRSSRARACP
jgi:hypothetical protein